MDNPKVRPKETDSVAQRNAQQRTGKVSTHPVFLYGQRGHSRRNKTAPSGHREEQHTMTKTLNSHISFLSDFYMVTKGNYHVDKEKPHREALRASERHLYILPAI